MAAIEPNTSSSLYSPVGYVPSVTVAAGSTIYTAAIAPTDADGATVGGGDVQAQARRCVANLAVALSEVGARLQDVAKVTICVAERLQADLTVAWDAVHESFGDHRPAAVLLGVTVLPFDEQLVQIDAVAVLPA
ncbi:RidA family protein [Williamsia sp. CHRR-6]|uniref:RidA family protein n=1 Tax=Williamsia sp. CHRR-6 TaxID=2835871 RepID=UPI001BDA7718|nr:Rid family hydrolase [Williamsia sp. CHRR-6]MBT0566910.1 RidA family protein [Williamsia sp. CHRR-6]